MYGIVFYRDQKGNEPVVDFIRELDSRDDKDARVRLHRIRCFIKILMRFGTYAGRPFVKHISGEIWELRPLQDRIFFAGWIDGTFVLLHYFVKKTQKTPQLEIRKAKAEFARLLQEHSR